MPQSGKVWRPLLNGEYPPPGPTTLGETLTENGVTYRRILVFAEPLDDKGRWGCYSAESLCMGETHA